MIEYERMSMAGRAMFYSHDTFGLGHLRRTLTLANHIRQASPAMSQLIVTGSPTAHAFTLPRGTDYIKLPSVTKNSQGEYISRSIERSFADIRDMRSDIVLSAARHFQPDFLIVDHAPAGLKGEAVATLRFLKSHMPGTKLILGLRDIVDEAPKVRQTWSREGVYELLDDIYDRILVYGQQHLYNIAQEYGLSRIASGKVRYVGYLDRQAPAIPAAAIRAHLGIETQKLVVVAAGGGGDGRLLFETVVQGLRECGGNQPFDVLLIGGPLMMDEDRAALLALLDRLPRVHFMEFTDQMTSYLAAADLVVSMGGYNTICELLAVGTPALIVPRVKPRQEQLIRAMLLRHMGVFDMMHPADLTAHGLLQAIRTLIDQPPRVRPTIPLNGLRHVVDELATLMPNQPFAGTAHADHLPSTA